MELLPVRVGDTHCIANIRGLEIAYLMGPEYVLVVHLFRPIGRVVQTWYVDPMCFEDVCFSIPTFPYLELAWLTT